MVSNQCKTKADSTKAWDISGSRSAKQSLKAQGWPALKPRGSSGRSLGLLSLSMLIYRREQSNPKVHTSCPSLHFLHRGVFLRIPRGNNSSLTVTMTSFEIRYSQTLSEYYAIAFEFLELKMVLKHQNVENKSNRISSSFFWKEM
ncbi:hypothetical protein AV530_019628 [Patagioenas fasciata monilis]|uniref:Uncharacterized protein n=1 Tax=Patagioenas fasciata monilis TaxID=372326 RepID=A0A1V4JEH3_PATFA|nr:hypothetical protein AV530_019628 [Patagioenas fasciata monilis]